MIDLLLLHGTIITMNCTREIIMNGAIAIDKGRIIEVGKSEDIEKNMMLKKK